MGRTWGIQYNVKEDTVKRRLMTGILLCALVVPAVAGAAADDPMDQLRGLLERMIGDVSTALLLVKLSVDAVDPSMIHWHLDQLQALLLGADEDAAARFGWPRERLAGLLQNARDLSALLLRLRIATPLREEIVSFGRNVQALLALALDEVRDARDQRRADAASDALLRASAYLVATVGLPINAYPGGLYGIAWHLGLATVLERFQPFWNTDRPRPDTQ